MSWVDYIRHPLDKTSSYLIVSAIDCIVRSVFVQFRRLLKTKRPENKKYFLKLKRSS